MFNIFNIFKRKPKLVACITYSVKWTDRNNEITSILIGLYEKSNGIRSFKCLTEYKKSSLEELAWYCYPKSKAHINVIKWLNHCLDISNLAGIEGIIEIAYSNEYKTVFEEIEKIIGVKSKDISKTLQSYKEFKDRWTPIIEEIKKQNPKLIDEIEVLLKLKL